MVVAKEDLGHLGSEIWRRYCWMIWYQAQPSIWGQGECVVPFCSPVQLVLNALMLLKDRLKTAHNDEYCIVQYCLMLIDNYSL